MTALKLESGARRSLPKALQQRLQPLIRFIQQRELSAYLVGGCVRDILLGKPAQDIDVVIEGPSDALARQLARTYRAKLLSHPQFYTHTLTFSKGSHLDIATARKESYAQMAALPTVEPASLQEDLFRRDFSINAIALSLNANDFGHLWDPFGGVEDLKNKSIRALHSDSFRDDPTRIFRAARFAARFRFELEWRTREWLMDSLAHQVPSRLSGARLREELIPLLMERDPRPAFQLLSEWGALVFLIPNLKWGKSHEAFFGRILKIRSKGDPLIMRLMVLMHALPYPKAVGSLGYLMLPQKLIVQAEQALLLLVRLRQGMLTLEDARRAEARPLAPEVLVFLKEAMRLKPLFPREAPIKRWRQFQDTTPCLSGQDVRDLGYKPGPQFSRMFEALREARWEGKLRTREEEIRFLTHAFPLNGGS